MIPFPVFATAGDAVFTLTSRRTGRSYTYRVERSTGEAPFFVSVLMGPDNTSDFGYIGIIQTDSGPGCMEFRRTKKAVLPPDAPAILGFAYSWRNRTRLEAAGVEFRHAGKCCRCGRPLTTPESIDRGLGPECASRMGF